MTEKRSLKTIKEELAVCQDSSAGLIEELKHDERKGAQKLLAQWQSEQDKKHKLFAKYQEMSIYEENCFSKGIQWIAGIDEVGRGPLAGPVVASAVILDPAKPIYGLDDSKKLSAKKRETLFDEIQEKAISIGIGIMNEQVIDEKNIYEATKLAMQAAIDDLSVAPQFLLLDAMVLPNGLPQEKIIKGDAKSISIAAASIIAKVTRDQMMVEYDQQFPGYGFAKNAGYGTKEHLAGIQERGICPIHRKTFAPIKNYL